MRVTRDYLLENGWQAVGVVSGYDVLLSPDEDWAIGEAYGFWYVVDFTERAIVPHATLSDAYDEGVRYTIKRNLKKRSIQRLVDAILFNKVLTKAEVQGLQYDGCAFTY